MIDMSVPRQLRRAINRQLAAGEVLVWLEQPDIDVYKRDAVRKGVVSGVLIVSLSVVALLLIFEEVLFANARNPTVAMMVVVSFMFFGIICLCAPLILGKNARRLAYALTNKRVLAAYIDWFGYVASRSIEPAALRLRLSAYPNDTQRGDIHLIDGKRFDPESIEVDFFVWLALRDVRSTEAALHRLIQSSSKSSL